MHVDSSEYLRVEMQQTSLLVRRQQEAISELQLVSVTQQQIITRLESLAVGQQASIAQLEQTTARLQTTVAAQVSPRFGSYHHCSFSGSLSFQTWADDQSSGAFSLLVFSLLSLLTEE
jgi:hypothetical protein